MNYNRTKILSGSQDLNQKKLNVSQKVIIIIKEYEKFCKLDTFKSAQVPEAYKNPLNFEPMCQQ